VPYTTDKQRAEHTETLKAELSELKRVGEGRSRRAIRIAQAISLLETIHERLACERKSTAAQMIRRDVAIDQQR
jgi:hypothetical protein